MAKTDFKTFDDYIGTSPKDVQVILEEIRQTVKKAVPEAEETISYQMPTFRFHGILVHFAAFKNHIGFYPTPSAIEAFSKELLPYESAKGSVKFPLSKPMPLTLISDIAKYKARENLEKSGK